MKIVRFVAVMVGIVLGITLAGQAFAECDVLHVLGFPGSCEWACNLGYHDAYTNIMCLFDILIEWT